jgi:hypothetical protein
MLNTSIEEPKCSLLASMDSSISLMPIDLTNRRSLSSTENLQKLKWLIKNIYSYDPIRTCWHTISEAGTKIRTVKSLPSCMRLKSMMETTTLPTSKTSSSSRKMHKWRFTVIFQCVFLLTGRKPNASATSICKAHILI